MHKKLLQKKAGKMDKKKVIWTLTWSHSNIVLASKPDLLNSHDLQMLHMQVLKPAIYVTAWWGPGKRVDHWEQPREKK
jgi:hypothetical protein